MTAPRTKVYFASDMHFGSQYHAEPRLVERYFVQWLRAIRDDARALILVGDIFDYWFEYKYVVPRGFTRILGTLAELSDSGVELHLFCGNHDVWMFDYLEVELGATIHRGPKLFLFDDRRFFVAHGDEFDRRNTKFRIIRSIFHSRLCQILYASLHPRWTVGFAHAWSLHSRRSGIRRHSERPSVIDPEREYLVRHATDAIRQSPEDAPDYFIFGHRHILLDYPIADARVLILGDWISYFSYAVWDGDTLTLQQLPSPYTATSPTIK